jgi:hypothetical protein
MAHLAPPLTFTLTPRQVAWLDGRRHLGCLSRSAALRLALDELILLEGERQGNGITGRASHGKSLERSNLLGDQPHSGDLQSGRDEGSLRAAAEPKPSSAGARHA